MLHSASGLRVCPQANRHWPRALGEQAAGGGCPARLWQVRSRCGGKAPAGRQGCCAPEQPGSCPECPLLGPRSSHLPMETPPPAPLARDTILAGVPMRGESADRCGGEGRAGWGGCVPLSPPPPRPCLPHPTSVRPCPPPRPPRGPFPHLIPAQPSASPATAVSVRSPRGLELPVRPCSWGGPRAPRPPQAPLSFPSAPRSPPVSTIIPPEAAVSSHSQ